MDKFQDLLTQAAQLKQSQLKKQRKNFESLPQYLKSGLNFSKKYHQLRKQHYYVQLHMSQKIKTVGNKLFALKDYPQALSKYQEALSIFRYIHAKKYENLKDEDIIYENYQPEKQYQEDHKVLLVALYLNICSSLTKMNKKQQAIHSSEEALKLKQTAKGYYKKAQAYLQYINKDKDDIKLGFYYLNKSYELSKDQSIIVEMHRIKKQIQQQRQKQQKWFKFMFDKNKTNCQQNNQINSNPQLRTRNKEEFKKENKDDINIKNENKEDIKKETQDIRKNSKKRTKSTNNQLQQFINDVNSIKQKQNQSQQNDQTNQNELMDMPPKSQKTKKMEKQFLKFKDQIVTEKSQTLKLQQGKQKLKRYLNLSNQEWKISYQQDFIHKNGSKIYSIIQLYNFKEYLIQYRSLLAKCLQIKGKSQNLQHKSEVYESFFNWIFAHPIQKYQKYIDRYNLQVQWIEKERSSRQNSIQQNEQQENCLFKKQNEQQDIKYPQNQTIRKNNDLAVFNQKNINQNKNLQQKDIAFQNNEQNNFHNQIHSEYFQNDKHSSNQVNKGKQVQLNQVENQDQQYIKIKQERNIKNNKRYQMKQQQQFRNESQLTEDVPEEVKIFLQDYGELDKKRQTESIKPKSSSQQYLQQKKRNEALKPAQKDYMNFFYTFILVVVISSLIKVIF